VTAVSLVYCAAGAEVASPVAFSFLLFSAQGTGTVPGSQPRGLLSKLQFGFTRQNELLVGRVAMLGFGVSTPTPRTQLSLLLLLSFSAVLSRSVPALCPPLCTHSWCCSPLLPPVPALALGHKGLSSGGIYQG